MHNQRPVENQLKVKEYQWAVEPILKKIHLSIGGHYSQYSSIEEYFNEHVKSPTISMQNFIDLLTKMTDGLLIDDLKRFADQLASKQTWMIDKDEFFSLYKLFYPPEQGQPMISKAVENKNKILELIVNYMASSGYTTIGQFLNFKKSSYGGNTIDIKDIMGFLNDKFRQISSDEKEDFIHCFRDTGSGLQISFEKLANSIKEMNKEIAEMTQDKMIERILNAAHTSFSDVFQIMKSKDPANTGYITFADFENGLRSMGVNVPSKALENLSANFSKAVYGKISYFDFVNQLEISSQKYSGVPQTHKVYQIFEKIRTYLREKKGTSMALIFQPFIHRDESQKLYIDVEDFRKILFKILEKISETEIINLLSFLDPKTSKRIDYLFFCTKLGYIQVQQGAKIPGVGFTQGLNLNSLTQLSPIEKKKQLFSLITQIDSALKARSTSLRNILSEYDRSNSMVVTQANFQLAISPYLQLTASQLDFLAQQFSVSYRPDFIDFNAISREIDEANTVAIVMKSAFEQMDQALKQINSPNLYNLLKKWDPKGLRKFTREQFHDILEKQCNLFYVREDELDKIVRHYEIGFSQVVEYELVENEYLSFIHKPQLSQFETPRFHDNFGIPSFANPLDTIVSQVRDFCFASKKTFLQLMSEKGISGKFVNIETFKYAIRDFLKPNIPTTDIANAVLTLKDFNENINLYDFNSKVHGQTVGPITAPYTTPSTPFSPSGDLKNQKKKILLMIADKVEQEGIDLDITISGFDRDKRRIVQKQDFQNILLSILNWENSQIQFLSNFLNEYDIHRNGYIFYDNFLTDLRVENESKGELNQLLTKLSQYLSFGKINLLELLRKADTKKSGHLTKDQILNVIQMCGFRENTSLLYKLFDQMATSNFGQINYYDFENKIRTYMPNLPGNDPTYKRDNMDMFGITPYYQEILKDLSKEITRQKQNIADSFYLKDYRKEGRITREEFISIISFYKGSKYKTEDLINLAKFFEDPNRGGIQYQNFLTVIQPLLGKVNTANTQLAWADAILDEMAVALYCKRLDIPKFFASHNINSNFIIKQAFILAIKDMNLNAKEVQLDQLGRDLDYAHDGKVSVQALEQIIEERKTAAIEKYEKAILSLLGKEITKRKIDLRSIFLNHDKFNRQNIASADFEKELRNIFQKSLNERQYIVLIRKYEGPPGNVNYSAFLQNIASEKLEQLIARYEGDPLRIQLVDKLRAGIRTNNINIVSMLLEKKQYPDLVYPHSVLMEIFPKEILTETDFGRLQAIIGPNNSETFSLEDISNLLWTSQEEESMRVNAVYYSQEVNKRILDFCQKNSINLEEEFIILDTEMTGFLASDAFSKAMQKNKIYNNICDLSALLFHQKLATNDKFQISYIDLSLRIFGKSNAPESIPLPKKLSGLAKINLLLSLITLPQQNLLRKLIDDITNSTKNILDEFKSHDPSFTLTLPNKVFLDCFINAGIFINEVEKNMLLQLPSISAPDSMILYNEFLTLLQNYAKSYVPNAKIPVLDSSIKPSKDPGVNVNIYKKKLS